jgi:hypothetical protein
MPSNYLRDDERIVRFVPWGKLRKDEDDNVFGSYPDAFALREGETSLSVTWCEYYAGSSDEQLRCAIEAIRGSRTVGAKARFAVGGVGRIRACAEGRAKAKKLRIVHDPEDNNPAHASIIYWPADDLQLLELLAEDEWSQLLTADDANKLPLTACAAGPRSKPAILVISKIEPLGG